MSESQSYPGVSPDANNPLAYGQPTGQPVSVEQTAQLQPQAAETTAQLRTAEATAQVAEPLPTAQPQPQTAEAVSQAVLPPAQTAVPAAQRMAPQVAAPLLQPQPQPQTAASMPQSQAAAAMPQATLQPVSQSASQAAAPLASERVVLQSPAAQPSMPQAASQSLSQAVPQPLPAQSQPQAQPAQSQPSQPQATQQAQQQQWQPRDSQAAYFAQPATSARQATVAQPATAQPATSAQQAATQQPATTAQQPANTQQAATAQQPIATQHAATAQQPIATQHAATAAQPPTAHQAATQQPTSAQPAAAPQRATAIPQHAAIRSGATAKPKPQRSASFLMGLIGALVGVLLMAGLFYAFGGGFTGTSLNTISGNNGSPITITPGVSEDATLAEAVAAKAMPSVVNIDVYASPSANALFNDAGNYPGSQEEELEIYTLGSGVILTEDGYILTNNHVISEGKQFMVSIGADQQYEAKLVGSDPSSDLAVIKVEASGLTPIEASDSSDIRIGQWVMALGSPFGLEKSVSTGIISALYRSTTMQATDGVTIYANLVQTDAAINPGNSGGALVDAEGKLIGINTLINSTTGIYSGVGFAIPSNYALQIADQIVQGKPVEHAFLGVTLQSVTPANAKQLGTTETSGVSIASVTAGSAAEQAGVKKGDIVVAFDGKSVSTASELIIDVRAHLVGDSVTMTVMRGTETIDIKITLGSDAQAR